MLICHSEWNEESGMREALGVLSCGTLAKIVTIEILRLRLRMTTIQITCSRVLFEIDNIKAGRTSGLSTNQIQILHKLYFTSRQLLIYDIRLYLRVKQMVLCNDKDMADGSTGKRLQSEFISGIYFVHCQPAGGNRRL